MAFLAEGVAEKQEDSNVESKGPSLKIAFDKDGNPTRAAQGFARGQGVDVKDLVQKDGYVYAVKHLEGKKTIDLLPAILDDILHSLNFPKPCGGLTMISGSSVLSAGWWLSWMIR